MPVEMISDPNPTHLGERPRLIRTSVHPDDVSAERALVDGARRPDLPEACDSLPALRRTVDLADHL
jgi:hypothetical protein